MDFNIKFYYQTLYFLFIIFFMDSAVGLLIGGSTTLVQTEISLITLIGWIVVIFCRKNCNNFGDPLTFH